MSGPSSALLTGSRSLTVVIVAHNDTANLDHTVERVVRALTITVEDFRIVIFDDGSRDGTAEQARRWQQKLPYVEVRHNTEQRGMLSVEATQRLVRPLLLEMMQRIVEVPGFRS